PYSRALLSAVLFPDPSRKPDRYVIQGEISSAIETKDECQLYPRCPIREEACSRGKPPLVEIAASHQSACRRWGHVS
ncbi:MAG: ABC transporter ATP-binding protein, partial [Mesorhizobium sp.]